MSRTLGWYLEFIVTLVFLIVGCEAVPNGKGQ
jgi:hypothetical protein